VKTWTTHNTFFLTFFDMTLQKNVKNVFSNYAMDHYASFYRTVLCRAQCCGAISLLLRPTWLRRVLSSHGRSLVNVSKPWRYCMIGLQNTHMN